MSKDRHLLTFMDDIHTISHSSAAIRQRREDICKKTETAICELLNGNRFITTVRERSGYRRQLLKPIYTSNDKVHAYFETENNDRMLTVDAFGDKAHTIISGNETNDRRARIYMAAYRLSNLPVSSTFGGRIREFIENPTIKMSGEDREYTELLERGKCLVFGFSGVDEGHIDNLMAIYLTMPRIEMARKHIKSNRQTLAAHVELMFKELEFLQKIEEAEFERQALRSITRRIPRFTDTEVSPATSVRELVNDLQSLLNTLSPSHRLGHTAEQTVTFVSVDYEEVGTTLFPILSIYPKDHAALNPMGTYLLSHRDTPSVAKYLLYTQYKHTYASEFNDRFSKTCEIKDCFIYDEGRPIGIVLTEGDGNMWNKLHIDITPRDKDHTTKTTAAFMLSKKQKDGPERVYAILAFESPYRDAFSKNDINLLREIVRACNDLLSGLKMGDVRFNYASAFRSAYASIYLKTIGDISYGHLVFELLRLDAKVALHILDAHGERPANIDKSVFPSSAVADAIRPILTQMLIEKTDSQVATILEEYANTLKPHMLEIEPFFRALPSNNIWHCYLTSVRRALSERDFNSSTKKPVLTPLRTGHSALAIFQVAVAKEIKQVLKLGKKLELAEERNRYFQHVRYQIPLAARLSRSGYAFDTCGLIGNDPGYGVLVSDLVGGNLPKSFHRLFWEICTDGFSSPDRETPSEAECKESIAYHFDRNLGVWRNPDESARESLTKHDSVTALKNLARLRDSGARIKSEVEKFQGDEMQSCLRAMVGYNQRTGLEHGPLPPGDVVESMFRCIEQDEPGGVANISTIVDASNMPIVAIVHGDLNGNNLQWFGDVKRFFVIDFERVQLGVQGIDQIKLIGSIISNSIDTSVQERQSILPDYLKNLFNVISFIRAVATALSSEVNFLPTVDAEVKKLGPDPGLTIVRSIIETIKISTVTSGQRRFWRYAWQIIMAKEFEYALRDLPATANINADLRSLVDNINISEGVLEPEQLFRRQRSDDPAQLISPRVIRLFLTFSAFMASLGREGRLRAVDP